MPKDLNQETDKAASAIARGYEPKRVWGFTLPEIIAGGSVIVSIASAAVWLDAGIQGAETHAANIEKIHKIDVDNLKERIDKAENNILDHIRMLREDLKK